MITISKNAAKELYRMLNDDVALRHQVLRISVIGGGCSGLNYKLEFQDEKLINNDDKVFNSSDYILLIVDSKSYVYLKGLELDYHGGLNGRGFVFINPNAKTTCGCGNSFGV